MSAQPAQANITLPVGWSVVGTRYGSQTDAIGNIVQGYTFVVQLPTRTQVQVFIPKSIVQQTDAVRQAIEHEGYAVLAIESL